MSNQLKSHFLLDPDIVYLNHGSFGACPKPVFEAYQRWQLELERQPMALLERRFTDLMTEARTKLAVYLGCQPDEVVYFPNPTTAINMVARSLALGPDDEILSTDHEYGAMDRTWRFICGKTGARYVRQPIPLPIRSAEEVVEAVWDGFSSRTKVVFISHITSQTALTLPAEEICLRAREAGVLGIFDGAHAPGQVPLDLSALGADLYTGACHKWLCAPKGSAFLYARREVQPLLEPLVVSWGWEAEKPSNSAFIDHHEWQGTRDPAAFLAVPAAIAFQQEHDWGSVRRRCHQLAREARGRFQALTGLEPIHPDSEAWYSQMIAARLPDVEVDDLRARLRQRHAIEVLAHRWNDIPLIRASFQGYSDRGDLEALMAALEAELEQLRE
jgi:isopenicillin-N epimerase